MKLSIIVPVLNEAEAISDFLQSVKDSSQSDCEIIVVDGGSSDNTLACCEGLADKTLISPKGRAQQMNAGAEVSAGDVLLFLHADTTLPKGFDQIIFNALEPENFVWGRFDISLSGDKLMFRLIETLMNYRSRITSVATGDQAIFVIRNAFQRVGGFPLIRLMEDVAICKLLRRLTQPVCLSNRVITSSRRWEEFGVWRTIFLMWRLRLAYFLGADPAVLAKKYR